MLKYKIPVFKSTDCNYNIQYVNTHFPLANNNSLSTDTRRKALITFNYKCNKE